MKKEFVMTHCKYVYIKYTFNVINIVLFVSENPRKKRTPTEEIIIHLNVIYVNSDQEQRRIGYALFEIYTCSKCECRHNKLNEESSQH